MNNYKSGRAVPAARDWVPGLFRLSRTDGEAIALLLLLVDWWQGAALQLCLENTGKSTNRYKCT